MAARGGARPNSGRKPGYLVRLEREFIASQEQEAEFAFAYVVAMMRGENKFTPGGFITAKEVMDRVWGKPSQTVKVKTWQDEIVALLQQKKVTPESVVQEFGVDLASELFKRAGVNVAATSGN